MQSANAQNSLSAKQRLRAQALAARRATTDRETRSAAILQALMLQSAYSNSMRILFYVHTRDEVQTVDAIRSAMQAGKSVYVPYCVQDQLGLFELRDFDDLAPGAFGVLEPKPNLRNEPSRKIDPTDISLVIVPGVAFDRHGGRLGYGKGFYDRLLSDVRGQAELIGLAFDCQLFEEIPMEPHDVAMDLVITESTVYNPSSHPCSGETNHGTNRKHDATARHPSTDI